MNILRSLKSLFGCLPENKPHAIKQDSYQERALRILVAKGEITLVQIGGNHRSKVLMRLRQAGFVMPLNSPGGERWDTNPATGHKFKAYKWSGKVPANWIKSETYIGSERRKSPRGNK
ncbi:hypothetical protein J2766_001075 [Agrobacterium tumefaciens]|uniref:Uncharacterized protein n=1 Tax=Agrobacterium tumefaciens TaxID=358 RepID=A0AAW8LPV0_AGRTU|nr:hypothetical protein [Agrobacterium tumefaciens]MBP2564516.1 hypothetical protein [Agrobacterium tumefaciens]MDR6701619.1 hypothetical protein [Agrobacterium tumefaciens]